MDLHTYLQNLKGKRVGVIGIGVSNRPLIDMLLAAGIDVTACDKRTREQFGSLAEELAIHFLQLAGKNTANNY